MPYDGHLPDYQDEILQTLIRADALLAGEQDWARGSYYTNSGAMCVYGAIGNASHFDEPLSGDSKGCRAHQGRCPAGAWFRDFALDNLHLEAAQFNDANEFADIKAVLASAIEKRRAEVLVSA